MVGFVESRLTSLVSQLESDLKLFSGLLIDHRSPHVFDLTSTFLISLPLSSITESSDTILRALALFEWRIETSGEIADWKSHHSSQYKLLRYEDLPAAVHQDYAQMFTQNLK
jgi:hypothetical protein